MKKRIGYIDGCLYSGLAGQVKKWYGWETVIYFDDEDEAYSWLNR